MTILRRLSLMALWVLAALGLVCVLVWGATALGYIKPLVVVSGSMEPKIMTGDLIVDTRVPASTLVVGDVVSVPSDLTADLVTHRIVAIVPNGDGSYQLTLKGDNNTFTDALDYTVSGDVWTPSVQLPGWGAATIRMTSPAVTLPLLIGLVGLLGLAMLPPSDAQMGRKPILA